MTDLLAPRREGRPAFWAIAACAAAASLAVAPDLEGLLGAALATLMLAIAAADLRAFTIPDELSVVAGGLGLVDAWVAGPGNADAVLWALALGAAAAATLYAIRFAYRRWRGREGLGLGDVKLAGVAGVWLDPAMLPVAFELAALAALGAYVLRQRARARALRGEARLPFGLFLAPAIWLCWAWGNILSRHAV